MNPEEHARSEGECPLPTAFNGLFNLFASKIIYKINIVYNLTAYYYCSMFTF
jgi:hypothetical protein